MSDANFPVLSLLSFADVTSQIIFGNLTVLFAPQASKESLVAQMWKLILDMPFVKYQLRLFGYSWRTPEEFFSIYFGQGRQKVWRDSTRVLVNGKDFVPRDLLTPSKGRQPREGVFYIPANRTFMLTYGYGWPLPLKGFELDAPYVLRQCSEEIRLFLEKEFPGDDEVVFPVERFLTKELREQLGRFIFPDAVLKVERAMRKRLIIEIQSSGERLAIQAWDAGQWSFVPLLLSLYCLQGKSSKKQYEWVVIEEPEIGLCPQAIDGVVDVIFYLLLQGYQVVITTHSESLVQGLAKRRISEALSTHRQIYPIVYIFARRNKQISVDYLLPNQQYGTS